VLVDLSLDDDRLLLIARSRAAEPLDRVDVGPLLEDVDPVVLERIRRQVEVEAPGRSSGGFDDGPTSVEVFLALLLVHSEPSCDDDHSGTVVPGAARPTASTASTASRNRRERALRVAGSLKATASAGVALAGQQGDPALVRLEGSCCAVLSVVCARKSGNASSMRLVNPGLPRPVR